MANPSTVEERWQEILNRPPDADFHYLKLSNVARAEQPDVAEVQSAAAVLDQSDDLRTLLTRPGEEETQNDALVMFWSTVELMIVLFADNGDKDPIRASARRALAMGNLAPRSLTSLGDFARPLAPN